MKATRFAFSATCICILISPATLAKETGFKNLREGDILFTGSALGQGEAIIAATNSPYTHCGVVFEKGGKLMVLEAVQPVGLISVETFISRGKPGTLLAKRLKIPVAPEKYQAARTWAAAQIGKNYDVKFQWGNDKLYCSELVWKIYNHAGVKLCKVRTFGDYDLKKPSVQKILIKRFGNLDNVPTDEKVVAPSDIAASSQLVDIPSTNQ